MPWFQCIHGVLLQLEDANKRIDALTKKLNEVKAASGAGSGSTDAVSNPSDLTSIRQSLRRFDGGSLAVDTLIPASELDVITPLDYSPDSSSVPTMRSRQKS